MLFVPEGISRDLAERIEVTQVDDWLRTTMGTVPVGMIIALVLYAAYWTHRGDPLLQAGFAAVFSGYATLFWLACRWRRQRREGSNVFGSMHRLLIMRFLLGIAWSVTLVALMRLSGTVERAMVASLPSGFMSTALFGGPALYALSFWVPMTIGGYAVLYASGTLFTAAPLACLSFYALLTFGVILTFDRKVLERNLAMARLEQHAETIGILLRDFEESASDWLWETDGALVLRHISERFAEVMRSDMRALEIGFLDLLRAHQAPDGGGPTAIDPLCALEEAIERRRPFREQIVPVCIGGERRWWALTGKPLFGEGGRFTGYRGVGSDVTSAYATRQQLAHLARHDPLTGLFNRNEFSAALATCVGNGTRNRTALFCLDLDEFKAINDGHGHDVGDAVLRIVAQRLRSALRPEAVVARLGGDEFAVLADIEREPDAVAIAERILETLARPFAVGELRLRTGISIGIAIVPDHGRESETIYRNADLALYRAKAAGRGTWRLYDGQEDTALLDRRLIAGDLRQAVQNGEIFVVYQPVHDLRTGDLVALEALVRWCHPTRGLMMPAAFVPLAEQGGMIDTIGMFVLASAADLARNLPPQITVAVNLSPIQLRDESLPERVREILARRDVAPARIELEITESVMLESGGKPFEVLRRLRAGGHQLAIDDFGVGYSSLAVLRSFTFDRLKIDRSFVCHLDESGSDLAILRAVVALGGALGISVSAEGVASAAQARRLAELGCAWGQGYYFSEPISAEQVMQRFTPRAGATLPHVEPIA